MTWFELFLKHLYLKLMLFDNDHKNIPETPLEKALTLQKMLIAVAENGALDENVYCLLRLDLMNGSARSLLPEIIINCRDQGSIWGQLKSVSTGSGSWANRRTHIYDSFTPLLDFLENQKGSPSDSTVSEVLYSFDTQGVHEAWEKALSRRQVDPEGAITASKTLLETVCKHILDKASVCYSNDDLPKLYGKTAKVLNLSPSQHTEQAFKAILGGCHTIVQNLGTLRNKIGDAHGQGQNQIRPSPRHAALAVNLAGSMASFLIETWNTKKP